jgi:hypothetical protein
MPSNISDSKQSSFLLGPLVTMQPWYAWRVGHKTRKTIMELGNTIQEDLCYRAVTHLVCRLQVVEELRTQRLTPEHEFGDWFFFFWQTVSLWGHELLRVVSVKCTIFWVCNARQGSASRLLHSNFLFGLSFNPEKAGDRFLRNVCRLLPNYTALQAWRPHFS